MWPVVEIFLNTLFVFGMLILSLFVLGVVVCFILDDPLFNPHKENSRGER